MGRLIGIVILGLIVLGIFLPGDEPPRRDTATTTTTATATASEGAPPDAATGKWRTSITTNPLDDTSTVVLQLEAIQGRGGLFSKPVELYARCRSNKTEVSVNWHAYLGDDSRSVYENWKWVTVRVGDQPAQNQKWGIATNTTATFAPPWAGDLLKQMDKSERLVLQTTPYNENPITAIFNTTGLDAALEPLMRECGWSLD